jgi:hypothetical protein
MRAIRTPFKTLVHRQFLCTETHIPDEVKVAHGRLRPAGKSFHSDVIAPLGKSYTLTSFHQAM